MARLERLREQVADLGIIPRREGKTGLPTEVYYLKVKELAALVEDPSLASDFIEMARRRSKKRRRKKYLKDTNVVQEQFQGGGHTDRLREALLGGYVRCLGTFTTEERFVSETGFGKSKRGCVYEVGERKVVLTETEGEKAWLEWGIPRATGPYRGDDLVQLLSRSEDRLYRKLMEDQ